MGELLPDRHPNRDFFIYELNDASVKDDMASMEHPVFSLATKPDSRKLTYSSRKGDRLVVSPSINGLATIFDKDILIYCISKLVHQKNEFDEKGIGEPITPYVEFSAHECMVACNWRTNDGGYRRFKEALFRLRGTTLTTDIETGGVKAHKVFGLIDEGAIVRMKDGEETPFDDEGRMSRVRIKLSDWMFRSIEHMQVLTVDPKYFRLRRPLERRLYEIARKHVGNKNKPWKMGLELLRDKVGSSGPLKRFRFNLREIIRDGNIPEYGFHLDGDMVFMQRLVPVEAVPDHVPSLSFISLRPATIDKAQKFCHENGLNFGEMEREWNEWANRETMKSADGSFIGFLKQKAGTPGARRLVHARKQAQKAHGFEQMQAPQLALGDIDDLDIVTEWEEVSADAIDKL